MFDAMSWGSEHKSATTSNSWVRFGAKGGKGCKIALKQCLKCNTRIAFMLAGCLHKILHACEVYAAWELVQDEGEAPAEQWRAGPAGPWRHPHWHCAPPAGRMLSASSLTDAPRAVQKVPHAAALEALACLDCGPQAGHAPAPGRAAGCGPAPMGADAVPGCALASDPPAMDLAAGSALTTRAAAGRGPEV